MCHALYCQKGTSVGICYSENGALKGTVCDKGKICLNQKCVSSELAPNVDCLYSDSILDWSIYGYSTPPGIVMNCSSLFQWYINTKSSDSSMNPREFCQKNRIYCCHACKSNYIKRVNKV
jgi:hypothetical protein